jgi:peptidoglycan/LPS O-acetylase OafA/YrhL
VPMLMVLALSLPWTHAALSDNEIWQEKAYLPGMAAIATGVLGALITRRWKSVSRGVVWLLVAVGALGLYLVMFEGKLLWQAMHDDYMLVLTMSALCLVLASAWTRSDRAPWRGLGWLRSWGRLSYEIYLTHMFVVYGVVRAYKAMGSDISLGFLWYLPALPLCWLLGKVVERYVSTPAERWLRQRMLRQSATSSVAVDAASL